MFTVSGHRVALHRQPADQQGDQGGQDSPAVGIGDAHVTKACRQAQLLPVRQHQEAESHGPGDPITTL
jgi:hypothetical protein